MAEDSDRPRRRGRLALLSVLVAVLWLVRWRRAAGARRPVAPPWPPPFGPLPAEPPRERTQRVEPPAASPAAGPSPAPAASPVPKPVVNAIPQVLLSPAVTAVPVRPSGADAPARPRRPKAPAPAGSAAPLPDGSPPGPEYTIKGAASMLFHAPSSPYYKRTKAELWFRNAEDARAAGFTEWTPKKRRAADPNP